MNLHSIFSDLVHLFATALLGFAVLSCHFIEVSKPDSGIGAAYVGFWQRVGEFHPNDNQYNSSTNFYTSPQFGQCVPWTSDQVDSFDAYWNFGRYFGPILIAVSLLASLVAICTLFGPPSSACYSNTLACLQFFLSLASLLLLIPFESDLCTEYDCFLDIGGVALIAASVLFGFCGCLTLCEGQHLQEQENTSSLDSARRMKPEEHTHTDDLSLEEDFI